VKYRLSLHRLPPEHFAQKADRTYAVNDGYRISSGARIARAGEIAFFVKWWLSVKLARRADMNTFVRNLTGLLVVLFAASGAIAQEPECTGHKGPLRLYVDVKGVRSDKGLVALTLYGDDSSKFLAHHGSLYVGRVPAKAPTTRVCIYLPGPGVYALAAYHDANADRKYNRTAVGLPAEDYGFSNDPPVFLGMPSFKRVRLSVPRSDMTTTIKLRYP
jgi:uncharacterized protein (DUF2141 family)